MHLFKVLAALGLLAAKSIATPVDLDIRDLELRASNETASAESFKVGCYHIEGWIRSSPTCLNYVALFNVKVGSPYEKTTSAYSDQ